MQVLRLKIADRIYEAHPVLLPGETMIDGSILLRRGEEYDAWTGEDDFNWIKQHAAESAPFQGLQLICLGWVHPGPYSISTGLFNPGIRQWAVQWTSPQAQYVEADRLLKRVQ